MSWIRTTRRWALYLRDGLACAYCGFGLVDVLNNEWGDNFLTLDHVVHHRRDRGQHASSDLITACYHCNSVKGRRTLRAFCIAEGLHYNAVRSRIGRQLRRSVEDYIHAADVLLGNVPGIEAAPAVALHARVARRQWEASLAAGDAFDARYADTRQWEQLWCPHCGKSTSRDEEIPF